MSQMDLFGNIAPSNPNKIENIVIWDVETQGTIKEAGGYDKLHKLKISGAVAYSSRDDRYHRFLESEIAQMVSLLQEATLLVGFNLIGFDIPVLSGYMAPGSLNNIEICDMLEKIHKQYGFRVGLGNIAEATLGVGKSADGLQAIEWFKQGKMDEVLKYCEQDVKVTKEVWEFGKENGFIYFTPKGAIEKKKLAVSW